MKANGKMGLIWFKFEWRTVLVTRKFYLEEKCPISPAMYFLTDRETPSGFGEAKKGVYATLCWRKILFKCLACLRKEERRVSDNDDRSKAWGFSYVRPYCITLRVILGWSQSTWTLNKELLPCLILLQTGAKCSSAPNLKQLWNLIQKVSEWESLPFSLGCLSLLKNHCIHTHPGLTPFSP